MRHLTILFLALFLGPSLQAPLLAQSKAPQSGQITRPKSKKVEVKPGKKQGAAYRKYVRDAARRAEEKAKRKAIDQKIRKTRAILKKQGALTSHIQVKVTLRNGEVMRGVVKNGLFIEKPTRLEFVRAEMQVPGAGIRLWYYNKTRGFIFLPYRTIKTYKILRRMSDIEVAALRDKMAADKELAKAEGKEAKKAIDKKAEAFQAKLDDKKAKAEEKVKSAAELKKESEETKLRALLTEFPPDEGWGPEKASEIRMRFINVGISPDPKSKRFLDNLKDWNKAYTKYANEIGNGKPDKSQTNKPAPGKPTPQK